MSKGHYVQRDDNRLGETVFLRFTHQPYEGEDCVYEEVVVDGGVVDCRIYPMDDDAGRDRLARWCVAPDMIPVR